MLRMLSNIMVTKEVVLAAAIASAVLAVSFMFFVWSAGRNVVEAEPANVSPALVSSVPSCDGGSVYTKWTIKTGVLYSCDAIKWKRPVMVERMDQWSGTP